MLGETIFGLDFGNHLWIVISEATADGMVAVANLTTHGQMPSCGPACTTIVPGEHSFVTRESCVYFRKAYLNPVQPLLADKERGTLRQAEPLSREVLLRIQRAALESKFVDRGVKAAISATLRNLGPI